MKRKIPQIFNYFVFYDPNENENVKSSILAAFVSHDLSCETAKKWSKDVPNGLFKVVYVNGFELARFENGKEIELNV